MWPGKRLLDHAEETARVRIMSETILLKLGGSIITAKHTGQAKLQKHTVLRIAKEISVFRKKNPHRKLIILHGSGSFSHPLSYQYRLMDEPTITSQLMGMAKTMHATRKLTSLLTDVFLEMKIPVIPLQTSALCKKQKGRIVFGDIQAIQAILKHGGIPLFGGDVVVSDNRNVGIASADALMVTLAHHIPHTRLLFATDVDGVYEKFPPSLNATPISKLTRAQIQKLVLKSKEKIHSKDVTGGMIGKLKTLLSLKGRTAVIFNGRTPNLLFGALQGDACGTTVRV